jgi:RHS repeat-associated protein
MYDSYGQLTTSNESITNFFKYTAREFDQETGIYDYRARYYDQKTGRFASEDPIRFKGGANFYIYSANNPTILKDPFGLQPCGCRIAASAAAGAAIGSTIGAIAGAIGGGIGGALAGGAGGTLVEPGGGTIVVGSAGAVAGAEEGAKAGVVAGAVIGAAIGAVAGLTKCDWEICWLKWEVSRSSGFQTCWYQCEPSGRVIRSVQYGKCDSFISSF